jgi:sugar/nucleoside kinase (ribokinase family)
VQSLAIVGSLARDLVEGRPPRPGGGVYYAARALRIVGAPAVVATKCAPEHRTELLPHLAAFGFPVTWRPSRSTTSFAFHYEGDTRIMRVESVGDPWSPDDLGADVMRADWVHVAALLRSDFPSEVLARLARAQGISLDAQALVRRPTVGPLVLDDDYDPAVLEHVRVLKLSEEEAEVVLGAVSTDSVRALGVREVLVTLGSRGSIVFAEGREERISVDPRMKVDPTGAGDAFAAAYLAGRAAADPPATAGRRASAVVAGLLAGRQG